MSKHKKLLELPDLANVDLLVAMSPENFAYVSESYILTVELIRPRHAYAILIKDEDPILLVCSIEKYHTQEESWINDQRFYVEFADNPIVELAKIIKGKKLKNNKIGMDLGYLPQKDFEVLSNLLPQIEIIDTTEIVASMRSVKSEDEVKNTESAAKITHSAVIEAMENSKLGETEKIMADRITTGIINKGSIGSLFTVFASGPRTKLAHAQPTDRKPEESEIIRFDVGGTFKSWKSDFARTYSTGNPTNSQKEYYKNLKEVQEETINFVKPGITAEDVFLKCKSSFEEKNMPFHMPHIGHSFGIELHEYPMLRPGDKTVIKEGMVFNVEPAGFDKDGMCYHLEDLLVVTDNGSRILTNGLAPKEIPVIGQPIDNFY